MKKILFAISIVLCFAACESNEPVQSFPVKGKFYQFYSTHLYEIESYTLEQILNTNVIYYDMYFRSDDTVEYSHSEWHYIPNQEYEGRAKPEYTCNNSWKAKYKQNEGQVIIYSSPELIVDSYWKDSIRYNGVFLKYNSDHGYIGESNLH